MTIRRDTYDTTDGIARHIQAHGLKGLFEIAHAREEDRKANYDLHSFIVMGRYHLDKRNGYGTISRITMRQGAETYIPVNPEAMKIVVDLDDLNSAFEYFTYQWQGGFLEFGMTPESKCEGCGVGWTLHDGHEVFGGMHRRCRVIRNRMKMRQRYEKLAWELGLTLFDVELVTNKYMNDETMEPWCILHTRWGAFEVGPRKRVFSLSWDDVRTKLRAKLKRDTIHNFVNPVDGTKLFASENVTKDSTLVHAWGEDKLVEYFKLVIRTLEDIR